MIHSSPNRQGVADAISDIRMHDGFTSQTVQSELRQASLDIVSDKTFWNKGKWNLHLSIFYNYLALGCVDPDTQSYGTIGNWRIKSVVTDLISPEKIY